MKNKYTYNILKRTDIQYVLVTNISYSIFVFITKPITDYSVEVLFYPIYICLLLFPLYIFFIRNHNGYVTNTYCIIRLNSLLKAYLLRIQYLIIETTAFSFVFAFMIAILNMFLKGDISIYSLVMVFFSSFLVFIQIGLTCCIIDLKFLNRNISLLFLFVIIVFDYFLSLCYFPIFFEFLSYPMMKVLLQPDIAENLKTILILLIRCLVLFAFGHMLFCVKNKGVI